MLTRRRLLGVGGVATAVAMLPDLAFAGSTPTTKNSWLERGTYNSRVGQAFRMANGAGTMTLTLAAVLDLVGKNARGATLAGRNDAFALAFTGPATGPTLQDTRLFTHPVLGQHPLFVVGGRGTDGKLFYTVTVNRSSG